MPGSDRGSSGPVTSSRPDQLGDDPGLGRRGPSTGWIRPSTGWDTASSTGGARSSSRGPGRTSTSCRPAAPRSRGPAADRPGAATQAPGQAHRIPSGPPAPAGGTAASATGASGSPPCPPPTCWAKARTWSRAGVPVEEAFAARRPAIRLLVVPSAGWHSRRSSCTRRPADPDREVEGGTLTSLAISTGTRARARGRAATICDAGRSQRAREGSGANPRQCSSSIRWRTRRTSARCCEARGGGVHGVLFPTHRQAPLSPAAVKARRAPSRRLLVPVDDLPGALADLASAGCGSPAPAGSHRSRPPGGSARIDRPRGRQ